MFRICLSDFKICLFGPQWNGFCMPPTQSVAMQLLCFERYKMLQSTLPSIWKYMKIHWICEDLNEMYMKYGLQDLNQRICYGQR